MKAFKCKCTAIPSLVADDYLIVNFCYIVKEELFVGKVLFCNSGI